MPNATETAAKAAKAKAAAPKALRQRNNEKAAGFLAIGIVGLVFLFMFIHWTRYTFKKYEARRHNVTGLRGPIIFARRVRSLLIRKAPGFPSFGHGLIFLGWFITCMCVLCLNIDQKVMNNWGKRLGWVAVMNLALVTFLSLKNTPLAYLTSYSYERINILHQIAGYGFVFWTVIHTIVYVNSFKQDGKLHELLLTDQIAGIVAGLSALIVLASALLLRSYRYEAFYIIHVALFIVIVITVGLHRPDVAKKTIIITLVIASMWFTDRLLRLAKISLFSFGNTATITPLAHGRTRVVLRKSSGHVVAGAHAFLWIPAIRVAETHPFTIVSTNPLEFVISAYDGFTRDLHAYAEKNPGKALKASIDGPYGCVPDFTAFNKVLLIAGGSGASFTFGVAVDLIRKLGDSKKTTIQFVWAAKYQESVTWFTKELEELRCSPLVTVSIHVTGYSRSSLNSDSSISLPHPEKIAFSKGEAVSASPVSIDHDMEKHIPSSFTNQPSLQIKSGRPDLARNIRDVVEGAKRDERIAVAACGPDNMMQTVRRTVAGCIPGDGPSVDLFLEQFGW